LAKVTSPHHSADSNQSGFGGRDNGIHAHDQYTQIKTIWVDLADDT
jgi:acyl-CoA reductase-like NAD-dependent aldehyde dehydrogenase